MDPRQIRVLSQPHLVALRLVMMMKKTGGIQIQSSGMAKTFYPDW